VKEVVVRLTRTISTNGEEEKNAYRILVGSQKGRQHWEDMREWEDNIKIDLGEVGWDGLD
jgi:hypothetical protein